VLALRIKAFKHKAIKLKKKQIMSKTGFVYIMTNKNKTTLYIGLTNNLCRRVHEHKKHLIKNSFTDKYNLEYCIYFEEFHSFDLAINREKELKKWNRQKKEELINKKNPEWKELVTGSCIERERVSFGQQVSTFLSEMGITIPSEAKQSEEPPINENKSHSI
jgi:putative endonuclease